MGENDKMTKRQLRKLSFCRFVILTRHYTASANEDLEQSMFVHLSIAQSGIINYRVAIYFEFITLFGEFKPVYVKQLTISAIKLQPQ